MSTIIDSFNNTTDIDYTIDSALKQMSLEQKIGQMTQLSITALGQGDNLFSCDTPFEFDKQKLCKIFQEYKIGSILTAPNNCALTIKQWQSIINEIQNYSIEYIGIPCLYGVDAIHGASYTIGSAFFPQQIGMAATFNRDLVKDAATVSAYETRASNIRWNFSPVLDMGRNALWARLWESYGEDTYLTCQLGMSSVDGYQGMSTETLSATKVAACLKHYAGYGVPYNGKDRVSAIITPQDLKEKHIAPFKKAIECGALSVMVNSGVVNGVSVHASKELLTDILKIELNFDGVVITDWLDIYNLYTRDKIADNLKHAIMLSINAGVDMAMVPYDVNFCTYLKELVEQGSVSVERIDDAVKRVLMLKYRVGLFASPKNSMNDYPDFGSQKHRLVAKNAANESVTLLKNEDKILPLKKTTKLFVVGPTANSMRTLNGGWTLSWQGESVDDLEIYGATILESIQSRFGLDSTTYAKSVEFVKTGHFSDEKIFDIDKVVNQADGADVIVICLGENSYTEKPGDIEDLTISQNQTMLVKSLSQTGKPIVTIINSGRPRIIREIEPLSDAILNVYLPGSMGGEAIADILIGVVNPSGRLPYTYPKFPNSLITYDHKPAESYGKMDGAYDYKSDISIQYPFGFGLSYSEFKYSDLVSDKTSYMAQEIINISVCLSNTSKIRGKESTLLYISDNTATITPDNKRLRAFCKTELESGQSQILKFSIPVKDLAFVSIDNKYHVEKGFFTIMVGGLSLQVEVLSDFIFDWL